MSTAIVHGVSFDSERPCQIHEVTWNGRAFKAGSYLLAALFAFQDWLDVHKPGWYLYVIQGAYNTTVAASKGTHDKDGCVDVAIVNRKTGRRSWVAGRWWLRSQHFYAWLRNTGSWAQPSSWHIHMIVVGITAAGCPVGDLVPGQISDAQQGRTGLKYHLPETARRPKHYAPFPYRQWVAQKEDEMTSPKNWDAEDWKAFNQNVSADVETKLQQVRKNGRSLVDTVVQIAAKVGVPTVKK